MSEIIYDLLKVAIVHKKELRQTLISLSRPVMTSFRTTKVSRNSYIIDIQGTKSEQSV